MYDDPWDDELTDDEDEDDSITDVDACPHCGAEIYAEAEQCPHCGSYVVFSTSPWTGRSWWWIVLAIGGIVAVALTLVGIAR